MNFGKYNYRHKMNKLREGKFFLPSILFSRHCYSHGNDMEE